MARKDVKDGSYMESIFLVSRANPNREATPCAAKLPPYTTVWNAMSPLTNTMWNVQTAVAAPSATMKRLQSPSIPKCKERALPSQVRIPARITKDAAVTFMSDHHTGV